MSKGSCHKFASPAVLKKIRYRGIDWHIKVAWCKIALCFIVTMNNFL